MSNQKTEELLSRKEHIALALELPESVYDDYTSWLRQALLSIAQEARNETIEALRLEEISHKDCHPFEVGTREYECSCGAEVWNKAVADQRKKEKELRSKHENV